MKIRILSDLHHFGNCVFKYEPLDEDVVVLAGDIGNGVTGATWARRVIKKPVIYVPGNHEFDRHDIPELHAQFRGLNKRHYPHMHVLINRWVMIDDVQFVGTTLFPNYLYHGERFQADCARETERALNDFGCQTRKHKKITPQLHERYYRASERFIRRALLVPAKQRVLVTHYSAQWSVADRYRHDPVTAGYAVPMPAELVQSFDRWYHGHTHVSFNYRIGNTRIICNPRGFDHDRNHFNPELIDDIGDEND